MRNAVMVGVLCLVFFSHSLVAEKSGQKTVHGKEVQRGSLVAESENQLLHFLKVMDYVRTSDITGGGNPDIINKCTERLQEHYLKLNLAGDEKLQVRCRKVTANVTFVKPTTSFGSLPPFTNGQGAPKSLAVYLTVNCEPRPEGERYRKEMSLICRDLARKVISGESNGREHFSNPAWQYEQLGCSVFSEDALNKIPNTKFTNLQSLECRMDDSK